jgi:hypothetical protein
MLSNVDLGIGGSDLVTVDASPKELEGKWAARFGGRIGNRPKMT